MPREIYGPSHCKLVWVQLAASCLMPEYQVILGKTNFKKWLRKMKRCRARSASIWRFFISNSKVLRALKHVFTPGVVFRFSSTFNPCHTCIEQIQLEADAVRKTGSSRCSDKKSDSSQSDSLILKCQTPDSLHFFLLMISSLFTRGLPGISWNISHSPFFFLIPILPNPTPCHTLASFCCLVGNHKPGPGREGEGSVFDCSVARSCGDTKGGKSVVSRVVSNLVSWS